MLIEETVLKHYSAKLIGSRDYDELWTENYIWDLTGSS